MSGEKSVVRGAVALTAAVGFVKILGALFKIPLANLLGGEGMGVFSTAYGLFGPIYAITVGGFPAALSALVSRYAGQGRLRQIGMTLRSAWLLFGSAGLLGSAAMWLLAGPFCAAVGNPGAVWCVRMAAPALFGCCAMSVWQGYYQGLGNMTPTALSQVAEAAVKVAFGLGGVLIVRSVGLSRWSASGMVGGVPAGDAASARTLLLPYMAAGATAGVTLSAFAGLCCLMIFRCTVGGRLSVPVKSGRDRASFREAFSALFRLALPICLGSAAVSLTTLVDLFTVMNCLSRAVACAPEQFAGLGLPPDAAPNFLYGSYQGLTVPLYLLIPTLTGSFGVSALPAVSRSRSAGDLSSARSHAVTVLRAVWLLAVPAGIGLSVLSEPLLLLLYPARAAEAASAAGCLRLLGAAGIFLGVAAPVNSLLQAAGKPMLPVLLLTGGAAVKLCVNLVLIPNPDFHILGAAAGSLACNLFLMLGGLAALRRTLSLRLPWGAFLRIVFAGFCCGLTAFLVSGWLPEGSGGTLAASAAGGLMYAAVLWALGVPEIRILGRFRLSKTSFSAKGVRKKTVKYEKV